MLPVPDALYRWDDAALLELRWPPLVVAACENREWLLSHYNEVLSPGVPPAAFVDALATVRTHSLSCDGSLHLVPGAEMFGRSTLGGVHLESRGDSFALCLSDVAEPNDELGVACGWRTNDELLLERGI
mmetsp:Transcript_5700/g.14965  ORF Transcript_5700/g.14965 Transcript_5700/m.14965 type:complete len:129 (+) Transcript_5700:365-751(+)